jgi:hypothetical protein
MDESAQLKKTSREIEPLLAEATTLLADTVAATGAKSSSGRR